MQIIIILGIAAVILVILYVFTRISTRHKDSQLLSADKEIAFLYNCKVYNLSNRETEVTRLMLKGWTYRAVATHLFIAEKTVDSHMQNIYAKTGVRNKLGLYNLLYREYP